jgi:hypothetical protein
MGLVVGEQGWESTKGQLVRILAAFKDNSLSVEELDAELAKIRGEVSNEVIDCIFDISTEMSGAPGTFGTLIEMLEGGISQQQLKDWLNA